MNQLASLEHEFSEVMNVANQLEAIHNLPLNDQNRDKVREVVQVAIRAGFSRQTRSNRIILSWGKDPLSEVVEIYSLNNKILVSNDRLWGSITGLKERIDELKHFYH